MNSNTSLLFKPITIFIIPIYHSILELLHLTKENIGFILKSITLGLIVLASLIGLGYSQQALWFSKWIGLGILSSIGFGFGMHTFVLFLAPHIAAITLAAHSCKSINFPEPPYPHEILCPTSLLGHDEVTFTNILQKVCLESFMWGLGTAIGELPPYLAARLRAQAIDRAAGGDNLGSQHQPAGWELWMIRVITKIGFIGILLCAAIPNPLFDAAGVASGIAQVPFLSFFGATFIGKAIIKVAIQSSFVILLFHNNNLDLIVRQLDKSLSELSPFLRDLNIHGSFAMFLDEQRTNVLRKKLNEPKQPSMISTLFNWFIYSVMILFMISVISNLDKQYQERKASKAVRRTE